jgi:mRNA interferase RelE/StbE
MAGYKVEFTPAARRDIASLPRGILRRIDARLLELGQEPHPPGATKLRDRDGLLRVRVGDYRIIYRVENKRLVVLVIRVGHRREIYR